MPEIQDDNNREIIVYSYRIDYRISDSIEIAAIIHAFKEFDKGQITLIPPPASLPDRVIITS